VDWSALTLSLQLALATLGVLLPLGIWAGRALAWGRFRGKALVEALTGHTLAFSFEGLLIASILFNLPFAIQPMQRAFEAIAPEVREAALCCGVSRLRILRRIEMPLAWPGILSAMVLTFAHTLGEFGVVLMVGGSIPGETKTIAIYDRVQSFDTAAAGLMSAVLLGISLAAIGLSYLAGNRPERARHG
jgi:molybdate transport system permease protein